MKHLVLITKNYPYDFGEEFLENEIEYLAEKFDKISVFATSIKNTTPTRELPKNAKCFGFNTSIIKIAFSLIKNLVIKNKSLLSENDRIKTVGNFKRKLYLSYFLSKSQYVYKKIKSKLTVNSDDELLFYSFWLYDTAVAGCMLKNTINAKSIKAISRAHGYDLYTYRNQFDYLPLRDYLIKNLDCIFPCSNNGTAYLNENYNCNNNIKTAYLGVRDNGISTKNDDTFVILSCAYISPVKRIDRLVNALSLLPSDKKFKWIHIGGGDSLDSIKTLANENLEIECDFRGNLKNNEIIEFYKNTSINLFVNTSSSEGLPVSIMEAQSFGIPAVATDVGGTSEIVKNDHNGYLIPADFTDKELADNIYKISNLDTEEYNKLCENSRLVYLESFNSDKNYKKFADEISKI